MAQKVEVEVVDDLDGSEPAGTVSFALDGRSYEIDLSDDNAARLRGSLCELRCCGAAKRRHPAAASSCPGLHGRRQRARADRTENTTVIRSWARENGHVVSERGRIPKAVMQAYQAAH